MNRNGSTLSAAILRRTFKASILPLMTSKNHIRDTLRNARQSLSTTEVDTNSQCICEHILALPTYQCATHIACYLSANNEADLKVLIQQAWQQGKQIYLPVINIETKTMDFYHYIQNSELTINHYKIKEPNIKNSTPINPMQLDLIITPVVGFDAHCNRLGQGGGFYDRYLSQFSEKKSVSIIGAAYEIQKLISVPTQDWDIPLDTVITEKHIY